MAAPAAKMSATAEQAAAPRTGSAASLLGLASTGVRSLRDYSSAVLEMVALESRLAGVTLAVIAGLALAVGVLGLTTWGLLIAAGVRGLMALGIGTSAALLIAAGANAVVAVALLFLIPRLSQRLTFRATRRALQGEPHE
jgi:hypothetical protein